MQGRSGLAENYRAHALAVENESEINAGRGQRKVNDTVDAQFLPQSSVRGYEL